MIIDRETAQSQAPVKPNIANITNLNYWLNHTGAV